MNKYNIIHLKEVTSTNDYLKDNYKSLPEFTIVYADMQTKGKGRLGRVWQSSSKNLEFSILLKPSFADISTLSLLFGLAVSQTIDKYIKSEIKWPNDIIVNDKKICGMLAEAISSKNIDAYIMGIGLNINETEFSCDLKDKATSLKLILNKDFDIKTILDEFIICFDSLYEEYKDNDYAFIDSVREKNYLRGKSGFIQDSFVKVVDINNKGNLVVEKEDGSILHLYSGEFSLNNFYNKQN